MSCYTLLWWFQIRTPVFVIYIKPCPQLYIAYTTNSIIILNRNSSGTGEKQLKTAGKTKFWNWNNLAILRGEFTFDFKIKMRMEMTF